MTRIEKLESEVRKLSPNELAAFRDWFRRYDSDEWDRQIERDILAGKLEPLTQKAVSEHEAGRTKEL